jgi:hypothetical protein
MYPFPKTAETIHWSKLPPAEPGEPLAAEWETYRREIGRLLAEGLEGKYALIRGNEIVGIYDTWDAARKAGLEKYLLEPHMVHPIISQEPVIRGPWRYCVCKR